MPTVVIPWQDNGDPYRARALEWVLAKYCKEHPDWEVILATVAPSHGEWCKGSVVQAGVRQADSDVVIVADADVWTTGLYRSVMAVTAGVADWAIPHRLVYRLTKEGTDAVLLGARWRDHLPPGRPYEGRRGGGFVVAPKDILLETPMDERFIGWGQEDESWDYALTCLYGESFRGDADLVHLWHQSASREDRRKGSDEGWRLMKRYASARNDPEAMRRLVGGVT